MSTRPTENVYCYYYAITRITFKTKHANRFRNRTAYKYRYGFVIIASDYFECTFLRALLKTTCRYWFRDKRIPCIFSSANTSAPMSAPIANRCSRINSRCFARFETHAGRTLYARTPDTVSFVGPSKRKTRINGFRSFARLAFAGVKTWLQAYAYHVHHPTGVVKHSSTTCCYEWFFRFSEHWTYYF